MKAGRLLDPRFHYVSADATDVAVHAEARMEFARVAREIARLEPSQRDALLTEFTDDAAPVSAAVRMARSRARRAACLGTPRRR